MEKFIVFFNDFVKNVRVGGCGWKTRQGEGKGLSFLVWSHLKSSFCSVLNILALQFFSLAVFPCLCLFCDSPEGMFSQKGITHTTSCSGHVLTTLPVKFCVQGSGGFILVNEEAI